jgi:hypothetical protein
VSIALIVTCLGFAACGGSGSKTVATVGAVKVSQATLHHWMRVTLGGDYQPFGGSFPTGLFTDPPDSARCARAAARIAPNNITKPKLTTAQLRVKCRQLYAAVKEQALNFILLNLWTREEAKELGVRAPSEREVSNRLSAYIDHDFKGVTHFREVIAEQRRSIADVRFMIKTTLLGAGISAQLQARAKQLGNGDPETLYKLIVLNNAKWQARTSCTPGYRASRCKQFKPEDEIQPGATTVIERFQKREG